MCVHIREKPGENSRALGTRSDPILAEESEAIHIAENTVAALIMLLERGGRSARRARWLSLKESSSFIKRFKRFKRFGLTPAPGFEYGTLVFSCR